MKAKLKALRNSQKKQKKKSARKNPKRLILWLLDKRQSLAPHMATRASVSNIDSASMYGVEQFWSLVNNTLTVCPNYNNIFGLTEI